MGYRSVHTMTAEQTMRRMLEPVDITIGGSRPHDIRVNDPRVYKRVLSGSSLAFGDSFVDGWWDTDDLAEVIARVHAANAYRKFVPFDVRYYHLRGFFRNLQTRTRSFAVGQVHYDHGNEIFEAMLDDRMVYSCAHWNNAHTLKEAQEQKLQFVCDHLGFQGGERLLDIGCGWGGLMGYAADRYNVRSTGLTVSEAQATWARTRYSERPLEFVVSDYRDYVAPEPFDGVTSLEMIEAVGPKNLRTFFEIVHRSLKPKGKFVLETSASLDARPTANAWLERLFPNNVLPSLPQLERASRGLFRFEYLENRASYYDRTIHEWWHRFDAAYPRLATGSSRDERFYRTWKFYLLGSAGFMRSGAGQNWHIVFSPIRYTK